MHARYAVHARIFFLSGFVSIENKERCIYLPKLVIRVRFPSPAPVQVILKLSFEKVREILERSPASSLCATVRLQRLCSQGILRVPGAPSHILTRQYEPIF